jgi:hypothetical protein
VVDEIAEKDHEIPRITPQGRQFNPGKKARQRGPALPQQKYFEKKL